MTTYHAPPEPGRQSAARGGPKVIPATAPKQARVLKPGSSTGGATWTATKPTAKPNTTNGEGLGQPV